MKKLNSELFNVIDLSNVKGGITDVDIPGSTKKATFTDDLMTQLDWKSERGTFQDYKK